MNKEKRLYAIEYDGKYYTNVWAYSTKDAIKRFYQGFADADKDKIAVFLQIEPKSRIEPEERAFCEGYALTHPTRRKNGAALFYKDYRAAFPYSKRTDAALRNMRFLPDGFTAQKVSKDHKDEKKNPDLLDFIETLEDAEPVKASEPLKIEPEPVKPENVRAALADLAEPKKRRVRVENSSDGLLVSFYWRSLSATARRRLMELLAACLSLEELLTVLEVVIGGDK